MLPGGPLPPRPAAVASSLPYTRWYQTCTDSVPIEHPFVLLEAPDGRTPCPFSDNRWSSSRPLVIGVHRPAQPARELVDAVGSRGYRGDQSRHRAIESERLEPESQDRRTFRQLRGPRHQADVRELRRSDEVGGRQHGRDDARTRCGRAVPVTEATDTSDRVPTATRPGPPILIARYARFMDTTPATHRTQP